MSMALQQFRDLQVGETLYRFDDTMREYTIVRITEHSCEIDRPCVVSGAQLTPGGGKRLNRKITIEKFSISPASALKAERERIQDLIHYHRKHKRLALEALARINQMEREL